MASSRVPLFLRKKYPALKAAWNYSVPSQHLLFSDSETQEGCEELGDALEESHNTNKIVVRLKREVRGLSLDENEGHNTLQAADGFRVKDCDQLVSPTEGNKKYCGLWQKHQYLYENLKIQF